MHVLYLVDVVRHHWQLITLGVLLASGLTVTQYFFLYATTYAVAVLHYSQQIAMTINFSVGLVGMVFTLIGGMLADKLGAMRLAVTPRLLIGVLMYPTLSLASSRGSPTTFLVTIAGLAALHSIGSAAPALLIARAFPASVRSTGFSISLALGISLFGGTAQILFTWIIAITDEKLFCVWYVIGMNALTITASLLICRYLNGPVGR